MSTVFNKKAIVLYGCAQLADGVSVINLNPTGTIAATAGSNSIVGTGTQFLSEVAPNSYLYVNGTNTIIGRVKTVNSNTSITLYANVAAVAVTASPGVMGISSTYSGVFDTGLGPDNALPVLDATFSTNYETEEYIFMGDELDRSALTTVKDYFGNLDFSVLMPVLGAISQTILQGTGTIRTVTGSNIAVVTSAANIAVNDFLYSNSVLIGRVQAIAGLNITLTGEAGIALTNTAYKIGKNTSTPVYENLPIPDWFQAAGFGILLSPGFAKISNSISSNTKLTVEVRLSSPDLASKRQQKVYTLTDVRGTIDLEAVVGSYGKLPFKYLGNLPPAPAQRLEIISKPGIKLLEIGDTISDKNISISALASYVAKIQVTFSPTSLGAGDTVVLGGLTYTSTGTTTQAQLVDIFSDIPLNALASELPVPATGTFSGAFTGFYSEGFNATSIVVYSPGQAGNLADIAVDAGTGPVPSKTLLASSTQPPTPSVSNVCFKKLVAPNVAGFEFTRFLRSCGYGWDKEAKPSDVTLTIMEDDANASYVPEKNISKSHLLVVNYGSETNNRRVSFRFNEVMLQKINNTIEDNSRAQDLVFRNIGKTDITLS